VTPDFAVHNFTITRLLANNCSTTGQLLPLYCSTTAVSLLSSFFLYSKVVLHLRIVGQSLHIIIQSEWITSLVSRAFERQRLLSRLFLFWIWGVYTYTHAYPQRLVDYKPLIHAAIDNPSLLYYIYINTNKYGTMKYIFIIIYFLYISYISYISIYIGIDMYWYIYIYIYLIIYT